jgi:hypothetical protein
MKKESSRSYYLINIVLIKRERERESHISTQQQQI